MPFIDTHIHINPPAMKAVLATMPTGDGFTTSNSTLDSTLGFMSALGTNFGVLSVSTPGPPLLGATAAGAKLARQCNTELAAMAVANPDKLGFFGVLPDWQDVSGTIAEIEFIYKTQAKANGVIVYSQYGDYLLGDPKFNPIWDALNAHSALIFIHPTSSPNTPKFINDFLPSPIVDFPQSTTRTVSSLIMAGTLSKRPNLDIVLSHAGGTFPYLAQRVIGSLIVPEISSKANTNPVQALLDAGRFYYDLALSNSTPQLLALTDYAKSDHIIFGSDYPYAPPLAIYAGVAQYAGFVALNGNGKGFSIAPSKLRQNAKGLLEKHKLPGSNLPKDATNWWDSLLRLFDSPEARNARDAVSKLSWL